MRCNICDRELTDKEVSYNDELPGFEPCTECLDVALDAAFSGGIPGDDRDFTAVDSSFDSVNYGDWSQYFSEGFISD